MRPNPLAPDVLRLRGLRIVAAHGALPEERTRPQPFEIDIDVWAELRRAGQSDELADTLDYGTLTDGVAAVVAGPHADLLEHLAERIAARVLDEPRAQGARVTVRKLRPPVPHDLASAAVTLTRRRRRAFLGLGSNLGDRWGHLRGAVAALPDVIAASPVYETAPVGGPEGQDPYLNAVVELRTARTARQLLDAAHAAESRAQRVRAERWGPRTLDVDVLLVGDEVVVEPGLVVPHARMWERGFVLVPLADLAPELAHPVLSDDPQLAHDVSPAGTL